MQRRAALAILCVFAVALSASLFPAGGFGSAPSGVGTGGPDGIVGSPGGGPPADSPSGADGSPDGSGSTGTTTDRSATTADPRDGADAPGESATSTTTTATTTEPETATGESDAAGGNPFAVVSAVLTLLGGLLAVGFWTGALGLTARAAGPLPFTVTVGGTPVGDLVGGVPARTMALVVGLSASVPQLLDDAADLARAVGGTLSTVAAGVVRGTGDALRIATRGLGATLAALPHAFAGLGSGAGLLSSLGSVSLPSLGRRNRGGTASAASGSDDADDPEETGPPTVEEAWRAMTDRVRVRNPDARTPGEFARTAVDRGYPDDAVERLTDAFREVRYGDLPRSARSDAARAALDRLRDHWRDRK